MSTEAENKNEKTKIVLFNENENNLKNVVTNITVTATSADRMLASAISLFDNKSYVPLTDVEMKELDDELEDEDSEHLSQVKEIKQYAKNIDKVFIKPLNGASQFDKYSLNTNVHADNMRYNKVLAIASAQYKTSTPKTSTPKLPTNNKGTITEEQKLQLPEAKTPTTDLPTVTHAHDTNEVHEEIESTVPRLRCLPGDVGRIINGFVSGHHPEAIEWQRCFRRQLHCKRTKRTSLLNELSGPLYLIATKDNEACITIAKNGMSHSRTRHIRVADAWIYQEVHDHKTSN